MHSSPRGFAAILSRGERIGGALAVALFCVSPGASQETRAVVTLATTLSLNDLGLLIADKRGYFREEGIDVNIINVDSAARVLPSLAAGDVDVAGGAPTASYYNAMARGIGVRIVADKTSTPPGRHSQTVVVRKALVDSGRVRSIADLKGLRIATAATGSTSMGTFERLYKLANLKPTDFEHITLNVPQQIAALQNGAIDAGLPTEPVATMAVRQGIAAKLMTDDRIYPDHQVAVMFYSGKFRQQRPREALAFMRGYLRGVRALNASLVDGKITGANADELLTIVTQGTPLTDRELARALTLANCRDDGMPNIASLKEDLDVFKAEKLIEGRIEIDDAVDVSFATTAVRELAIRGP